MKHALFATCGGVFLSLCLAAPLLAQLDIPLDTAAINRLGLVFTAVTRADPSSGTRLPATVIAAPDALSELRAVHGGVLESWQVQAGEQVAAGAVLAVLQSPAVLELQQQWMAARAADQQAQFALGRDQDLFSQGIIARQRLEESARVAQTASFSQQALAAALAQAGHDSAALEALQGGTGLGRYTIRAPFAGVVTTLPHRTGDMIEPGEAVVSVSGEALWASAELPARLAGRVQSGQGLMLAGSGLTLQVRQIEQAFEESTQTAELLASFDMPVALRPGQVVTLVLPPQAEGVLVPSAAVVHNSGDTVVYVRTADGVQARTLVLQPNGTDYLATAGLAAGEEVVVRGAALLKGITLGLGGE